MPVILKTEKEVIGLQKNWHVLNLNIFIFCTTALISLVLYLEGLLYQASVRFDNVTALGCQPSGIA